MSNNNKSYTADTKTVQQSHAGIVITRDEESGLKTIQIDEAEKRKAQLCSIVSENIESRLSCDFRSAKNYVPVLTDECVGSNSEALRIWVKVRVGRLSNEEIMQAVPKKLCDSLYKQVIKALEESQCTY